jgi:hypothetical protein
MRAAGRRWLAHTPTCLNHGTTSGVWRDRVHPIGPFRSRGPAVGLSVADGIPLQARRAIGAQRRLMLSLRTILTFRFAHTAAI